ncbi:hypothetical protein KP509_11G088000 [Ceratopteris richardii]|uniref:Uncharacterized protein n=1 Tax=Ceratopteris richardii TaxID=49495 RepID=A0A8T2TX61_CERRI|nr:hypothetical protein KP509_11G088000 [Ceratopteris richardii]
MYCNGRIPFAIRKDPANTTDRAVASSRFICCSFPSLSSIITALWVQDYDLCEDIFILESLNIESLEEITGVYERLSHVMQGLSSIEKAIFFAAEMDACYVDVNYLWKCSEMKRCDIRHGFSCQFKRHERLKSCRSE